MEEDPAGLTSMSDFDRSTGTDEATGLNDPNGTSEENLVTDNKIFVTLVPGEDDKRTTTLWTVLHLPAELLSLPTRLCLLQTINPQMNLLIALVDISSWMVR